MAAIIAHELAHVNERHSFKQMARSISGYLIVSVLTGDVGGIASVFLENTSKIGEKAHSRSAEKEADILGLKYLKEAFIRPSAMTDLLSRLIEDNELSSDISNKIELLSTHPMSQKRLKYINEMIQSEPEYWYNEKPIMRAEEIWNEMSIAY